ncbi:cell differentiation protein rcd1-like [Apium graveolens]|uniref:cell differentiation protein rcd1-like n=1 Tax=Apium graveolens TaxID=4045 RepID=UPI003D78BC64
MLNLPDSLYPDPIQGDNSVMSNGGAPANNNGPCDGASKAIDWPSASVEDLVVLLREPEHREKAISSLTHIKEVLSIYKSLTPEKLTMKDSSKVCDVLVLFEVISAPLISFSSVQIHCYLYPFLETEETSKPFQYLRLMSLGVIGGLLKETASWIMSRIMMQEQGLQYCCEPANRLCAIMKVFNDVIEKMQDEPSTTFLKNIIQCYVIMSDDPSRGYLILRSFIPPILTTAPYIEALRLSMGCGPNAEAVGDVAGSSHLDR